MAEHKLSHHGFSHTDIEHFEDGSAAVHHVHSDGPHKDFHHAVVDLDGIHDSLEEHLRDPHEIEEEIDERGVDHEKLEEVLEPGIHDKALDYLAEKDHVDPDAIEEKVSPGIHEKMARLVEED
jgi:hypothetical protein